MFAKEFLLKKNYQLICRIGEGTYATVYKAKRITDSLPVAVKMINVFKMDKKKIENALNEIRIICAIDHPNVVGYHEAFLDQENKDLYIIMEYVGGGDLNDRIRHLKERKTFLPEKTIWKYALQILQGLKALHDRKIIHRDIKPGNIFVSEDLEVLKIGDLNVSKIMRDQSMTATVIGTPYYLAPEIWKNDNYDYRCDVFSFGCVLYEMTALHVPFQGKSIGELFKSIEFAKAPSLPKQYTQELYQFIRRSLIKKFQNRPSIDKLLNEPLLLKRRKFFQDVVHNDPKGRIKMFSKVKVETLTDLGRILPSLKNMRSNSVKALGMGAKSFNRSYNSGRNFQNFSHVSLPPADDGSSLNKSYKTKKKKGWLPYCDDDKETRRVRRKGSERPPMRKESEGQSMALEARKNYSKLVRNQRLKREQMENEKKKNKTSIKIEDSTQNSEFKNRPESKLIGLDDDIIQIIDDLAKTQNEDDRVVIVRKLSDNISKKKISKREFSVEAKGTLKKSDRILKISNDESLINSESYRRTKDSKQMMRVMNKDKSKTSIHQEKNQHLEVDMKKKFQNKMEVEIKSERKLSKTEKNQKMIEKEQQFFLNKNSKNSKSTQQLQINYFPVKKKQNSRNMINDKIENNYDTIHEMPEEGTIERQLIVHNMELKSKLKKDEESMQKIMLKKSSKYIYSKKKSKSKFSITKNSNKEKKSRKKISNIDTHSSNFGSYSSKYTNSTNTKKLEKLGRKLFKKNSSKKKKSKSKKPIKKNSKKENRKIMNPYLTDSNIPKGPQRTKSDHGKNPNSIIKKNKNKFKKTDPSLKNNKDTKNYLFPYSNTKQTTSSLNITQQDSDNLMESMVDSLENTYSKERFQNKYKLVKSHIPKKRIRFRPNTNPNSPKNLKVKMKKKRFSTHNKNKSKGSKGVNLYSDLSKGSKIKKQNRFSGPSQKKKILTKGQNKYMDLLEKKKLTVNRKKSPKINLYQAINLKK
jgi:serine/threonine protein kinase